MKSMSSTVERTSEEDIIRILVEQAPVGVSIVQDGKFCYVNSYLSIATGYTADELIGKDSLEIVVPNDREMVRENTIKMLKGEILLPYQFKVTCKDGSIIWVMSTVKSIQYHWRQAVLGNYMEITGRKQLEDTLKDNEERYKELADSITDVFFAMDEHLRYTYWNKASEILTGIPAEDAIGKSLHDIFPDTPGLRRAEKLYRAVLRTQKSKTFVNDFDIDGRHYIFEISAYRSRGGISVFVRDITARKQAEEAWREAEEEKSAFLEEAPVGIIHTDLKGKISYVNKRFESESGYLREEIIGKSGLQLDWFPTHTTKYFTRRMAARLRGGPAKHWETQFKCKDGRWIWIELEGKILRRLGVPVGFQIIAMNITDRKQAEEALQIEKNKLQSVVDAMADALTIQDTEYNIIYQNEPARISSGGDRVGEKCYRVYEGRESICEDCPIEKAFKDSKPHTSERQRALPSEELSFWETIANPIRDARGEIVSCLEIGRDITERKKQEQALSDELTRRRLLVDQSIDGIVVLDVDAKVYEANQRFAEMLGYTLEEVRELHTWDWDKNFPPEQILEMGRNVDENGLHLETKHTRKDGSVIDVDISINGTMCGGQKLIFCACRDVTERREIEEALRESEKKLRLISENSRDIICLHDPDHRYVYISPACKEILGYEPDELVGTNPWELVHPEDIEALQKEGQEKDLQGTPILLSYRIRKKSGEYVWFESVSQLLKDGAGNVLGFVTSSRDITERKQTQEALMQSEDRYRTILEEMEDAYFEVDLGGHLTFVNSSVCRDLGYSREELLGMSYKKFTVEEDIEAVFQIFNEVYHSGAPNKGFPWMTIRKDGSHGFAETSVSTLRNDNDEIIGFRGVGRDITEHKRAEDALRQSEENYRALFDSSVIGSFVLDTETMKILIVNQAAAAMFGFSSVEEAIGVNPLDLIPPDDRESVLNLIMAELFEQDSRTFDIRVITRDNREIWISATGARILHDDELSGLICFTDITEQKQQNERLMMTDRLASLGELASGAAHELNNPLTSIIGFSQLLVEKEVPDDIREDLNLINNEARRAVIVTNNLLSFARKHSPVKQLNQINNIIEDVLELRVHEHTVNHIDVERHLDPDLPEIMVDYFQIQQVFMNIIINAEYFMIKTHNSGTLTITTQKANNTVRISFADDGPGIPPENLGRIFDPFFTTKEAGSGTGLGLSICHGIVNEHSGQIYVRSQLGKGATIFIELPIKRRARVRSLI